MDEVSYQRPANFIFPHFCVSAINHDCNVSRLLGACSVMELQRYELLHPVVTFSHLGAIT